MAALEFAGRAGRDASVPVEHVHGDAARGGARGRRGGVRGLRPRRPLHVVRRLRGQRVLTAGSRAGGARGLGSVVGRYRGVRRPAG